ncbi:MAG: histidinol dehydrogenase [Alphaproteobacteria bacterium]|nr:histidinol dehydrogenase [Alphaproteobacteria bacterium]
MPLSLDIRDPGFEDAFQSFLNANRDSDANVEDTVKKIIADIRQRGDEALFDYTKKFDHVSLTSSTVRIPAEEIAKAKTKCSAATLDALRIAATRIEDFHRRLMPADLDYHDELGIRLGARWTAIESVGLYVPGDTAAYPSSVLMNAIPAKVAGVPRIAMVVPTPRGEINPLVLAAAQLAGVEEIYTIGGAQAVAALAYGTHSVPPVVKITGPGNAYVAAAKREVFGVVGIDMIAGPSEILIVADSENDPAWIAADLLSQAEHDAAAQSILITDDKTFAKAVENAVTTQLAALDRSDIATRSWRDHGAIFTVETLNDAIALVDRIAPEHLELAVNDPDALAVKIRNAGAIFLGRYTPEAIGDYIAGPNHVLPTSRSARFSSGLSVHDFMKRTTFVGCSADALSKIGPPAMALANAEGLGAHERSIAIRVNARNES